MSGSVKIRVAAVAFACVAAVMLTGRPASADPTPTVVTVSGTSASGEGFTQNNTYVNGLTLKPWYFFGKPLLGNVWGKFTTYVYKTRDDVQCLFGLAWDIHITDTPTKTVSFKCLLVVTGWTIHGSEEVGGTVMGFVPGVLEAGDGTEPDGYLFRDFGYWERPDQYGVDVHVDFL